MAKQQAFLRGAGVIKLLSDTDWITIINSLLTVNNKQTTRLAKTLLAKTKHGRQVRLLRLIKQKRPRLADMQKSLKNSPQYRKNSRTKQIMSLNLSLTLKTHFILFIAPSIFYIQYYLMTAQIR